MASAYAALIGALKRDADALDPCNPLGMSEKCADQSDHRPTAFSSHTLEHFAAVHATSPADILGAHDTAPARMSADGLNSETSRCLTLRFYPGRTGKGQDC